jgi:hypothetical protein
MTEIGPAIERVMYPSVMGIQDGLSLPSLFLMKAAHFVFNVATHQLMPGICTAFKQV